MLTITYIQAIAYVYIHRLGSTIKQLVQDPDHSTIVVGVMEMGNIVPRAGIKPTSLVFRANVRQLHHLGSLMPPIYPCPPVCVLMELIALRILRL